MSSALRRLGFEVTIEFDADRVELTEALRAFTRRSARADVSLVFYAGHAVADLNGDGRDDILAGGLFEYDALLRDDDGNGNDALPDVLPFTGR